MVDQRKAKLILSIETKGAGEATAAVKRLDEGVSTLERELKKMGRADLIQKVGAEMGLAAKRTRDFEGSVVALNKRLKELGASKDEIASAAGAFESARTGGGSNALARAGSELRALPSTQTGLGFGTDAVGNVLRLSGALTEVAGKSALTTSAIGLLTPALGAQTAATVAAAAPIALFVAGFAAIAIALKSLTDATAQNVDRINTFAESQRTLSDKIASGLTSEEAKKELEELNTRRKLETDTLNTLQAAYDKSTQQLKQATIGGISLGNAFDNISKIVSQDEQALADQIEKSKEVYQSTEGDVQALTAALEDGSLAANDAAEAEKKLADERSKAALTAADSVGKELAARQKADDATGEQNQKRLDAIANEKEVLQAQIDSLNASGVTSEDVTAKIASLTEQLGLLGKESSYISDTALAASKARDAEKKAQKDAEDNAKKAQQAQEAYTKSVKSATDAYRNSVQDIGTRLSQTLQDNTLKLNRDLTDISAKYARDQYDIALKSYRAEQDAYQDQIDDLENIRRKSAKDEQDALIAGDFKQLYLARTSREDALKEEAEAIDKERQKRAQNQAYALEDLRRANERQRSDRIQGYERANTDARAAQQRDLQQAALTRNRALQVASEGLNAELKQLGNYYAARLKMDQQYQAQSLKMAAGGASTQGANATSPFGSFENSFTTAVRR